MLNRLLCVAALLFSQASFGGTAATLADPMERTLEHDGLTRTYLLYVPVDVGPDAPLIIVMHGYMGSAQLIMRYSAFNTLANQKGFIVAYPQGTIDQSGYRFFNVGYDTNVASKVDDIDFIKVLTLKLQRQFNATPARTFLAGNSNGGDMAYLMGCTNSELYGAIASITGVFMKHFQNLCMPTKPLPVFQLHGTEDVISRYEGDMANNDGYGAYFSVPEIISFWTKANDLDEKEELLLEDIDKNDNTTILFERYFSLDNTNEVWSYILQGGGHRWPMAKWSLEEEKEALELYGATNRDISATYEIWRFFQHHLSN